MKIDFNKSEGYLKTGGVFALCFSTFYLDLNVNSKNIQTLGIALGLNMITLPLNKAVLLESMQGKE